LTQERLFDLFVDVVLVAVLLALSLHLHTLTLNLHNYLSPAILDHEL
jgi:hypothetical protein